MITLNFEKWDDKDMTFFFYHRLKLKGFWTPLVRVERAYFGKTISKV